MDQAALTELLDTLIATWENEVAKLRDALTPQQKARKIGNLLSNLRRAHRIRNTGPRAQPVWTLAESKLP
jgi:hypothetical protein